MPDVTLTVPAEFAEEFRAAVVREIAFDVRQIEDDQAQLVECKAGTVFEGRYNAADARLHLSQLAADAALAGKVDLEASGAVELTAPAEQLAHVCELMAQEIIRPRISRALDVCPVDNGEALRPMIAALSWAVDNAERLYAEWADDRKAA